jgi:uncharacterized membrane protein YhiD involved in acid resistance
MNYTVVLILALGTLIALSRFFDREDIEEDEVEDEVDELAELEAYIDSRDELIASIDNIYYSNVEATIEMYHNSKKELDKMIKNFEKERKVKK